jgi:hypothetical protein
MNTLEWTVLACVAVYLVVGWPLHTKFIEEPEKRRREEQKRKELEEHHTDDPHNEIMAEDFFLAEEMGEE